MKNSSLQQHDTKFVFEIQQWHVELYINPANHAPGIKYGPTPGVIIGP